MKSLLVSLQLTTEQPPADGAADATDAAAIVKPGAHKEQEAVCSIHPSPLGAYLPVQSPPSLPRDPAAVNGRCQCADLWQQWNLAPCFISWPTKQFRTVIESYTILTILPFSVLFHWIFFFFFTTLFLRREKNASYSVFKAIPSSNTNTNIFTDFLLPSTNSNNVP